MKIEYNVLFVQHYIDCGAQPIATLFGSDFANFEFVCLEDSPMDFEVHTPEADWTFCQDESPIASCHSIFLTVRAGGEVS